MESYTETMAFAALTGGIVWGSVGAFIKSSCVATVGWIMTEKPKTVYYTTTLYVRFDNTGAEQRKVVRRAYEDKDRTIQKGGNVNMSIKILAIIVDVMQVIGYLCLRNSILPDSVVMRSIMQVLQILCIIITILYIVIKWEDRQKQTNMKFLREGNSILVVGLMLVLCYNWYYLPNCRIVGLFGMFSVLVLLILQRLKGLKREVNHPFFIVLTTVVIILALSKNMPQLL